MLEVDGGAANEQSPARVVASAAEDAALQAAIASSLADAEPADVQEPAGAATPVVPPCQPHLRLVSENHVCHGTQALPVRSLAQQWSPLALAANAAQRSRSEQVGGILSCR